MFRKCKNLKETHKILSNEQVNEKHNNNKKKKIRTTIGKQRKNYGTAIKAH